MLNFAQKLLIEMKRKLKKMMGNLNNWISMTLCTGWFDVPLVHGEGLNMHFIVPE
jgi:hypothetical protein